LLSTKDDIIARLRQDILLAQGFKPPKAGAVSVALGPVNAAFPNDTFPTAALHEFISTGPQKAAASGGFVAGLASTLMAPGGACLWISGVKRVFPPGLVLFGVPPDRIVFVTIQKEKHLLWAVEEALKRGGLAAVVGEARDISFTASRRLQLAIEQSQVTAFVLRDSPRNLNPIASIARWRISPIRSRLSPGLPGVGHPRWTVQLDKIKHGHPGIWQLEWRAGRFQAIVPDLRALERQQRRKTS
jgi:protein ImuA